MRSSVLGGGKNVALAGREPCQLVRLVRPLPYRWIPSHCMTVPST